MQKQYLLGPSTWKVMKRNVWKDIAILRIKRLNKCTNSQRHASMTINLNEENGALVYFRKSHVSPNKLDGQETDFSFTQLNRSGK